MASVRDDALEKFILDAYFASHGGVDEFRPLDDFGSTPEADKYWQVDVCTRHPKSSHHASSCGTEIAYLTRSGMDEGKRFSCCNDRKNEA